MNEVKVGQSLYDIRSEKSQCAQQRLKEREKHTWKEFPKSLTAYDGIEGSKKDVAKWERAMGSKERVDVVDPLATRTLPKSSGGWFVTPLSLQGGEAHGMVCLCTMSMRVMEKAKGASIGKI